MEINSSKLYIKTLISIRKKTYIVKNDEKTETPLQCAIRNSNTNIYRHLLRNSNTKFE